MNSNRKFNSREDFLKHVDEILKSKKCEISHIEGYGDSRYYFKKFIERNGEDDDIVRYPSEYDLTGIDSLAYVFLSTNDEDIKDLENWNVSHIEDFTGSFDHATIDSYYLRKWDVSNGKYFDNMFYGVDDVNSFKYIRDWDCSKGVSYNFMFYEPTDWNEIDYNAVSHIKVNPNASFLGTFKDIPREYIELFRNWFPDDELVRIYNRLTGKLLIEDADKNLSEYEYWKRHFRKVPKNNRLSKYLGTISKDNL